MYKLCGEQRNLKDTFRIFAKKMPYRRLPTTDKARLRAIDAAVKMAMKKDENLLAFSKHSLDKLNHINSTFQIAIKQYKLDTKTQSDKNIEYKASLKRARMYVSHFIQVLFMAIERDEIKSEVLGFYGLEEFQGKVLGLNSEQDILEWGNKIIDCEQKRIQNGGSPIYSPSIALVKINVQKFNDAAIFQQNLKRNTARSFEKMQELRKLVNVFISRLWTEIEENVVSDSPKHNRQRAQEYGIVYVFRRNEKTKIKTVGLQTDLLFDFG